MPRCFSLIPLLLCALPAHAVIVRGKVTDALGHPLPGSRVQLISLGGGPRNAADSIAGYDGSYELRSDRSGRFLLLTSPSMVNHSVAPQIGDAFYGGRTDLLTIDIALAASSITPESSSLATLFDTPLQQLSDAPVQVSADQLVTQAGIVSELRPNSGLLLVQLGQTGTPAQLLLRGAPVAKAVVDGVSAEEFGGRFNLATVTSSGLAAIASTTAIEVVPDANPLYALDAENGALAFETPVAATLRPTLNYSADAGGLSTVRNEAVASLAYKRADALLSFARLNTDNDEPAQRIHLVTAAANLGYHISANTSLRATLRDDVDASPLPSPYLLYRVAPATKLAEQNLYGSFTVEGRTAANWHNLLRFGLVRERRQAYNFATPATGAAMSFTGANGYTASGTASFLPLPSREDAVTNRDEYSYQTDYPFAHFIRGLLTARYQEERGADLAGTQQDRLKREHFSVAASLVGQVRHRFFYAGSGFIDHASDLGWHGSPSLGLTYVSVFPGSRRFRGTSLHLTAATGVGEPSVLETALTAHAAAPRSRTLDVAVDQGILPRRLDLRVTYFHDQLSHQLETPGLAPLALSGALAYRTQGLETALQFHPVTHFLASGGYTFLAAVVEQSAATAVFNPNLAGIAIGATTALVGARPFDRAPSSGFVSAQYTASSFSASVKATFVSRSDGSTGLVLNPTLLLPNRNLSPGYASVDAAITYSVGRSIMLFTQLDNLLDQRQIAPAGYVSTPFLARAGIRIRLGRE